MLGIGGSKTCIGLMAGMYFQEGLSGQAETVFRV
jgi:hypothetical protein